MRTYFNICVVLVFHAGVLNIQPFLHKLSKRSDIFKKIDDSIWNDRGILEMIYMKRKLESYLRDILVQIKHKHEENSGGNYAPKCAQVCPHHMFDQRRNETTSTRVVYATQNNVWLGAA